MEFVLLLLCIVLVVLIICRNAVKEAYLRFLNDECNRHMEGANLSMKIWTQAYKAVRTLQLEPDWLHSKKPVMTAKYTGCNGLQDVELYAIAHKGIEGLIQEVASHNGYTFNSYLHSNTFVVDKDSITVSCYGVFEKIEGSND